MCTEPGWGRVLVGMVSVWRAVESCWSRGQAREITDGVVADGDHEELSAQIREVVNPVHHVSGVWTLSQGAREPWKL